MIQPPKKAGGTKKTGGAARQAGVTGPGGAPAGTYAAQTAGAGQAAAPAATGAPQSTATGATGGVLYTDPIRCDLAGQSPDNFRIAWTRMAADEARVRNGVATLRIAFETHVIGDEMGVFPAVEKLLNGVPNGMYQELSDPGTLDHISCARQQDWTPPETRQRVLGKLLGLGPYAQSSDVATRLARVCKQVTAYQLLAHCVPDADLAKAASVWEIHLFQEAAARAASPWDSVLVRRLAVELNLALDLLNLDEVADVFGGNANNGLTTTVARILNRPESLNSALWAQAGSALLQALGHTVPDAVSLGDVAEACVQLRVARGDDAVADTARVPVSTG